MALLALQHAGGIHKTCTVQVPSDRVQGWAVSVVQFMNLAVYKLTLSLVGIGLDTIVSGHFKSSMAKVCSECAVA